MLSENEARGERWRTDLDDKPVTRFDFLAATATLLG